MNSVEPIREQSAIDDIAEKLKEYSQRDYVLFYMGIYLGRRISDILSLRVKDVKIKITYISEK